MEFDKTFFDNIHEHRDKYIQKHHTGVVTLTVALRDRQFNVAKIAECGESLLSFYYYDEGKTRKQPKFVQEKFGEQFANPLITIPYSQVYWIELNPGQAGGKKTAGFKG